MKKLKTFLSIIVMLAVSGGVAWAALQTINTDDTKDQTITGGTNISIANTGGGAHKISFVSSFTSGSIMFSQGASLSQDNSNLFWDDINNRLGIGTNTPSDRVDVNGTVEATSISTNSIVASGSDQNISINPTGTGKLVVGGDSIVVASKSTAPSSPTVGQIYYDTTLNKFRGYAASGWISLPGGSSSLTTGLISFWKLDESSGNALDSVGSATLTNINSVSYVSAKINNGGDLENGTPSYFKHSTPSALGIQGNVAWSVQGWVKFESLPTDTNAVSLFGYNPTATETTGAAINILIKNNSGSHILRADNLSLATEGTGNLGLTTGTWYHIVVTYNPTGTAWRIYVNNVLKDTVTRSGNNTDVDGENIITVGASYYLGGSGDKSYAHLDGIMDAVGFWNRTLDSSEISELYNSGSGLQYPF